LKVVLITSGQPALNPRLVKEADSLILAGYEVTVIYAYWNDWGTAFDAQFLPRKKWKAIRAGGHPTEQPAIYLFSRIWFKLSLLAFRLNLFKWDSAISRSSFFLTREAKKHRADLYIAHNLGALPAAFKAAGVYKKPCWFDAEDFHRYETTDDENDAGVQLKIHMEDKYIPRLNYLSASSPQIGERYEQLYPGKKTVVLLNVFPKTLIVNAQTQESALPVKLFWFSQTIGKNRGVEQVIGVLKNFAPKTFQLHLLGKLDDDLQAMVNHADIFCYPPIPPDEIVHFASQFDIGLSTELNEPQNRDICLTNKLFTYIQSGLAVIASDTSAQNAFFNNYPNAGKIYNDDLDLKAVFTYYLQNPQAISETKKANYDLGQTTLNWENESIKFLEVVTSTLNVE
jgi:glycosyltransferase involved in cell wall biosynthesis